MADFNTRILENIGIKVNVEEAYNSYVTTLGRSSRYRHDISKLHSWRRGGVIGWWRHKVWRYIRPRAYCQQQSSINEIQVLFRQALLNAILENAV